MDYWANALIELSLALLVIGLISVLGIEIVGAFGTTLIPVQVQQVGIGLNQLNQISQEYTNNTNVQSTVSQAQSTLLTLTNQQLQSTAQGVSAVNQGFTFMLNVLPMVVILIISIVVIAVIFDVVAKISRPAGAAVATM
jgi:uncharacterized membrane protein